jgi:hypothetical protein
MKPTDEYKLGSLEEAEEFAKKRNQQLVEEAPYHPGYEDAVITPRSDPVYRGMDPAKMLWKSKPLSNEEMAEKIKNMEIWEKKYLDRIEALEKELKKASEK